MLNSSRQGRATAVRLREMRRGIAGMEFALIAPILVTLVIGVVDITDAIITWRHLSIAAEAVAEIATEMSAQPGGSNLITATQVWQASTAAFGIMPGWKSGLMATSYAITVSSVVIRPTVTGCTTACTYVAKVAWSVPFSPGITEIRTPCAVESQVANNLANSLTTLPVGVIGPSPLLVVDIFYEFQPMFVGFITGPIAMLRSAYLQPRIGTNAQYIVYSPSGTSVTCLGY